MRERQYFLFGEIADALARKPGRHEVDGAERDRIVLDLADWTRRSEFDLSGDSEVVTLIDVPPYFVPIAPVRPGEILTNPDTLILRCDACRRYVQNSPLDGAPKLLRDWFREQASGMQSPIGDARPKAGEPKPDNPATLLKPISGQVMPPDEAEGYTLLWDAATEMSRANRHPIERNWLRLMDGFWRGRLAPASLVYFCAAAAGREFFVLGREVLAGMLLGHRALETGAASIDDLRHWRIADYRNQPSPFVAYFQHDPEGRLGLAVAARELDRWLQGDTTSAKRARKTKTEDDLRVRNQIDIVLAAQRRRWPDSKPRPSLRQQARLIREQLRDAHPPLELGEETIRQILSGNYGPKIRRGM